MNEQHAQYQRRSGESDAVNSPCLITRRLYEAVIRIVEYKCDIDGVGRKAFIPYEDGYLILFMVRDCEDQITYCHKNIMRPLTCAAGATVIYDLLENLYVEMTGPYHFLHFHLPCKVLNGIADELGVPRIGELAYRAGTGIEDHVLRQLFTSLLPYIGCQNESNSLFLDYVALAISTYIAQAYGGMHVGRRVARGGLAPWQERKAKELLTASVEQAISLNRLAQECGLSVRHFARAFRQSTGVSPHRWLLERRVEQAKGLLVDPALPLSAIALSCGFSDQSHFTRVYSALVGMSPGAWRRARIHAR